MTKAILISVKPEHAVNILNGTKTLELRKSVPKGFKGWVYMYVTKGKPLLVRMFGRYTLSDRRIEDLGDFTLSGKIVARFWFDEYKTLEYRKKNKVLMWDNNYYYYTEEDNTYRNVQWILDELRLEHQQVLYYGNGKDLYAWHIKKLEIFDKPMELSEFTTIPIYEDSIIEKDSQGMYYLYSKYRPSWHIYFSYLNKAPQSWQYVWTKGE